MQKITFYVTETDMEEFRYYLQERENSTATIGKYLHDVRTFRDFLGDEKCADKEKLLFRKNSPCGLWRSLGTGRKRGSGNKLRGRVTRRAAP